MVKLTVTDAAKAAIDEYCRIGRDRFLDEGPEKGDLESLEVGDPVDHHHLVSVSKCLVNSAYAETDEGSAHQWRLDKLLRGASVYQPPPPPKPEPTPEFKALMQRLREQEERRKYERMLNPPSAPETFSQRFPNAASYSFSPAISHGQTGAEAEDDMTYADVNRQMILIINVLISIVTCAVFIWIAARRWTVPQRLGLSMSGSGLVAAAEVAIYMGYIRRLKDAKEKEVKAVEKKEIQESWVTEKTESKPITSTSGSNTSVRSRKGRHR